MYPWPELLDFMVNLQSACPNLVFAIDDHGTVALKRSANRKYFDILYIFNENLIANLYSAT